MRFDHSPQRIGLPARVARAGSILALLSAGCGAGGSNSPPGSTPDMAIPAHATHCNSLMKDGDETDIDCGGSCNPCNAGQGCLKGTDCLGAVCTNKMCAAASCTDGVKNGPETDVDCGGGNCPACDPGKSCVDAPDCKSAICTNGSCAAEPCADGKKDGMETDVDCGGGVCPKCALGKMCASRGDCDSGLCPSGVCTAPLTCMPGTADCDGNPMNGCEVQLGSDPQHCGVCTNSCPVNLPHCSAGKCVDRYAPMGIQKNVAVKDLFGWSQCFLGLYSDKGLTTIPAIQQQCSKKNLMLACRQTGSSTLSILAWAPRTDVFFDTGAAQNGVTHVANGVGWYFNENWSWGFVPPMDMVFKNRCDGSKPDLDQRMCWHTGLEGAGSLSEGFNCGDNSPNWLNTSSAWERLVYQAD